MAEGRKTVAARVLASYAIIMTAFALAAGWSVVVQRRAADEARLMRDGYLPLSGKVRDLAAKQETWRTQLNHMPRAENPADVRAWLVSAARIGRPDTFGQVRAGISRAFLASNDATTRRIGRELMRETSAIEEFMAGDAERLQKLFAAIDRNDKAQRDKLQDELVSRGNYAARRLDQLEQRVLRHVDVLLTAAQARERLAIRILIALSAFTVLVGVIMALYARRVLSPLALVTERAKAVTRGDLRPRPPVVSNDEIGEFSATFESMVAAIARANEQLLAAERLATIGKMAAHVTHEIRNPLSSMALNVELLEDEVSSSDEEARALIRAIRVEVERLTALSEQYLSFARRQPFRLEDENLADVLAEACDFMRKDLERHGVELRLERPSRELRARVDEAQIKQAIYNLVRNAQEAMPGGGKITVSLVEGAEGGVDILVDDEGSGLDEEARQHLFEPFFTTKHHGTGLGLAITKQIVESHSGAIRCELRPGGGTRMVIHLPGKTDAEPAARPSEPGATLPATVS